MEHGQKGGGGGGGEANANLKRLGALYAKQEILCMGCVTCYPFIDKEGKNMAGGGALPPHQ